MKHYKKWITFTNSSHKSNPTSVPQGYVEFRTLVHVGGGNGVEGTPCKGLQRHTLANWAPVEPSQGGRNRAEPYMALGQQKQGCKRCTGEPGRTPLYAGHSSAWGSVDSYFVEELLSRGDTNEWMNEWKKERMNEWMNEWTTGSRDGVSLSRWAPSRYHGVRAPLPGNEREMWGFIPSGALAYWGSEGCVKEGSIKGHFSPYRPRWGPMEGRLL